MPQDFSLNQLMAEFTALSAVNQQTVLDWVRTGQDLIDYITEAGSEVDLTEYSGEAISLTATDGPFAIVGSAESILTMGVGDTTVIAMDGPSGNIIVNASGNLSFGSGQGTNIASIMDLFLSGEVSVQVNAPIMYLTATTDEVVGYIQISSDTNSAITIVADSTTLSGDVGSAVILDVDNAHLGKTGGAVGFFGTGPISKPSGVAVTVGAVHAALVSLGLIAA